MGRTLWLQALCGALAAGLVLTDAGAGWRGLFALPVILGGGAALGPLLAVTPVEPSRLKLALFSSLLSPLVIAALFAALHLGAGLAPRSALAGALAIGGALALLGLRSTVRTTSPGRQESAAVLVSFAAAIALVLDGWGGAGSAARLADGGEVVAATVADGWLAGRGLDSPWFAGGPLDLRPAVSLVVAVLAGGVGAQPSFVAPLIAGWAAALVGCSAYLACAALARESSPRLAGARDLLAVVAALLALPATRDPSLVDLQGVGAIDPAEALTWAFGAGVLLSGLHALRSGAAPWPALLGASILGLTLVHPFAGAAAAAAMAAAASLHRRPGLAVVALGVALPGLLQGRAFGGFGFEPFKRGGPGFEGPFGQPTTYALATAALLVPTLIAASVAALRSKRGQGPSGDGRTARGWTVVALLAAAWLGLVAWESPRAGEVDALHRTALPALVLSAALAAALHRASRGRARAIVLGAAAVAFLTAAPRGLQRPRLGDGVAVRDELEGLVMSGPADAELLAVSRALSWIRGARGHEVPAEAALVLRPRGATRPDRPSLAPLASGLSLWASGVAPPGARQDRRFAADAAWSEARQGDAWALRAETLEALFTSDRGAFEPRLERVLRTSAERGLPRVFVLTDADHRRLGRLDAGGRPVELARLGAELLRRAEGASVYLLRVPQGEGGSSR
ncbi:MAG: hypothetical protein VX460_12300 [Planctomycetota bacterium]|nr:hypothetical protein [Planctomycetota bacterium]